MGRLRLVSIIVLPVLLLAGCLSGEPDITEIEQVSAQQRDAMQASEGAGGGEGGSGAARFVAVDIAYEEAPPEVAAGTVVMELVNEGSIVHNIVIEELGDELVVEADGGETATGDVDLEPGTFTYYCDIAGHRAAGMEGTLTVTG